MKKLLIILIISASAFAQREKLGDKMDHVKAMKIAHITSELALTSDEASRFWPIYNAFEEKERQIRRERVRLTRPGKRANTGTITEAEALAALTKLEENEAELHRERMKFHTSLKQVLPATKILKLATAEDSFGRKLLRQYKAKGTKKK